MPIHFRCPHCDKLLALGTRKGGMQIHCPMCDRVVTVPPRTEVQLPTTTVVPPDDGQAWWIDAPADAWWLTVKAPPPPVVADAPAPAPAPEPPADPLVFETPAETTSPAKNKATAPVRVFPIWLVIVLVGSIIVAAIGVILLLL